MSDLFERISSAGYNTKGDICVIQTAFLGDLLLTVPLLRGLRIIFPKHRISLIVRDNLVSVLEDQGICDNILPFHKGSGTRALMQTIRESASTGNVPEILIFAQRSFRSGLAGWLAGVPNRIGHRYSGAWPFLTRQIPWRNTHEASRLYDLLRPLTARNMPDVQEMYYLEESAGCMAAAKKVLGDLQRKRYLVVAPGSVWDTKRWSAARYGRLITHFWQEYQMPSVLTGSKTEIPIATKVMAYSSPRPLNLAGFTDFEALKGVVSGASAFVSGDTGTAHIAAAYRIPQVTIFGPTIPAQGFYPLSPESVVVEEPCPCRPCGSHGPRRCPLEPVSKSGTREHRACMRNISVEKVFEALKVVIQK